MGDQKLSSTCIIPLQTIKTVFLQEHFVHLLKNMLIYCVLYYIVHDLLALCSVWFCINLLCQETVKEKVKPLKCAVDACGLCKQC